MNSLILIYQRDCGTQQEVEEVIDGCHQIEDWFKTFPSVYFLHTTLGVKGLTTSLHKKMPNGTFLVIRPGSMDGVIPDDEWAFLGMSITE